MINSQTFLLFTLDIGRDPYRGLLGSGGGIDYCALLTIMLLATDMDRNLDYTSVRIRVQTASSSNSDAGGGAQWSPVKTTNDHRCL
jgi:hypothetical protein